MADRTLTDQVNDLFGGDSDGDLAKWVTELTELKQQESQLGKQCDELKARIIAKLKELGTTSMKVAGRRIGLSSRTYYGVDKNMLAEAKAWLEQVAPEVNIPASANIGKAVEAYLEQNPSATLPPFIVTSETETFTNAKA